jgi:hypothetical protein
MESMPAPASPVTVGVDTHLETHVAAVVDQTGRLLDTKGFPASTRGYVALVTWAERFGPVARVGVEGTGTFGAGLARFARAYGLQVVEVARPDRSPRRRHGKSDPIDAQAAARATLAGVATVTPKTREGQVEMIRVLRVARRGAMKARVAAAEQLYGWCAAPPRNCASRCSALRPRPSSGPVRPAARPAHQHHRRHQDHPADPGPPLATASGRARPVGPPAPRAGHLGRPGTTGTARSRGRDRRPAAGHRGRQPSAAALGGCLRPSVRHRPHPGVLRPHRPLSAQPRG